MAYLLLFTLLSACSEAEQQKQPQALKPMSKVKDTPETRAMLAAFQKQKHRLEFNGCEMRYNGKPFHFGMTVKEIKAILGPYDFFSRGRYVWKEAGIVFTGPPKIKENNNRPLKFITVNMEESDENNKESDEFRRYPKKDYFLLNGVPVNNKLQFRNFIKNSYFELSDFSIDSYGYSWPVICDERPKKLEYSLFVRGGWIYTGGGHIRFKSKPNSDNINTIKMLHIAKVESQDD